MPSWSQKGRYSDMLPSSPALSAISATVASAILSSIPNVAKGDTEEVGEGRLPFDTWRTTTPFSSPAFFPVFLPTTTTKEIIKKVESTSPVYFMQQVYLRTIPGNKG